MLANYLLTLLNIKAKDENDAKEIQQTLLVCMDFMNSKFGHLTTAEIKEAFKMYVAGDFADMKVFRILDSVVVGEVLNAYQNFRNESLRVYDSKKKLALSQPQEMTLEQKQKIRFEFLKMLYSDFQTKDYVFDSWTLYDELAEKGKILLSDEEKRRRYIFYRTEYFNALKSSKNASSVLEFKRNVEKAENAKANNQPIEYVVKMAKAYYVSEYLKEFATSFETFCKSVE